LLHTSKFIGVTFSSEFTTVTIKLGLRLIKL
jgi:hypothetical protein